MEKHDLDNKITKVSKTILSYCMARTSNQHDAEDLAQDIICEIMKSSQNIRNDCAFYGFMWSVARNVYKQWYKKKLRVNECELTENVRDENADFKAVFNDKSDIYLLRREMSLLSQKYRRATILYYLKNKQCSEIASLLSISESMVKYLLFKSRKILKEGFTMERNYGKQSYSPKNLNIMYMGEGPNHYWQLIEGNKIRQNILWACYNDRLTEEEIALQIGVSLPYIEDDIKKLTDTWLLKKDGNYYRTNIIILTEDFDREKASEILPFQKEIANTIKYFLDNNESAIRNIGFLGCNMSLNSLKWHMSTMMLFTAYHNIIRKSKPPISAFGEHSYVWGTEKIDGGFNCCTINAAEWNTGISMYFMDWLAHPNIHHSDFYSNRKLVKVYDKIAHGLISNPNEYEQEIIAEMIRKGYIIQKDGKISIAMPIYTKEQLEYMTELQKPVVTKIGEIFKEIDQTVANVLKNHVPTHLKSQVEAIASMSLFHDGTYTPALLLNQNGYLSIDWTPGEIATSYVVLKAEA